MEVIKYGSHLSIRLEEVALHLRQVEDTAAGSVKTGGIAPTIDTVPSARHNCCESLANAPRRRTPVLPESSEHTGSCRFAGQPDAGKGSELSRGQKRQ